MLAVVPVIFLVVAQPHDERAHHQRGHRDRAQNAEQQHQVAREPAREALQRVQALLVLGLGES